MQVVSDYLRIYIEQPSKMIYTLAERAQSFEIFQVANVMRHESMLPLGDAKRVLELGAARQDRPPQFEWELNRLWRVASRTPNRNLPPSRSSHDAIVSADMNLPIVNQKII